MAPSCGTVLALAGSSVLAKLQYDGWDTFARRVGKAAMLGYAPPMIGYTTDIDTMTK